jgi:ABC-type uncharacterized transport system permease subunit
MSDFMLDQIALVFTIVLMLCATLVAARWTTFSRVKAVMVGLGLAAMAASLSCFGWTCRELAWETGRNIRDWNPEFHQTWMIAANRAVLVFFVAMYMLIVVLINDWSWFFGGIGVRIRECWKRHRQSARRND